MERFGRRRFRLAAAALALPALLAPGAAPGDDPAARALLERAQREAAFTLGVQQSMERARAGTLGARDQLELDARQRDQREQQDALFYQQQIRTYTPVSPPFRHAETMRAEQERQDQLSRFRFDSTTAPTKTPTPAAPAPLVSPTIGTAPVPRAAADPAAVAALRGASPARPAPLAPIQRVEHDADALWRSALAGDWGAAAAALDGVRRSVDMLRSEGFAADYAKSGGRAELLSAVLGRLDDALSGAGIDIGAQNADALMHSANDLMLTAAELVPDIVSNRVRPSSPRRAAR